MSDPVLHFEHSHASLTRLALEVRERVRAQVDRGWNGLPVEERKRLLARLQELREELLRHFANEEEGLFPFVRHNVPDLASAVDKLQDAHDSICGSLVRLAHLVDHMDKVPSGGALSAVVSLHDRFEKAYAEHSQDEARLLEGLGRRLDQRHRVELAELLRGL
jgi:iron-sulfur cluster repair protein YtfE (RIC family)